GGGSAGLVVAAGAAQMGADTVLIEGHKMGGDCLNYGCVPSKSLLAAGKAAKAGEKAAAFGVNYATPEVDFSAVHDHVHDVIAGIAPHDSVERFEGLGVRVIEAMGRFIGASELEAGDKVVAAKRFVIATGSRAVVPPIPGLESVDYLTNETIFDLKERPKHLIVIGGGPIGCELGQAFRNLGADVSIAEMATIMPNDDQELVDLLRTKLLEDGIALFEKSKVVAVERTEAGLAVRIEREGKEERIEGSHLLLAAGRKASLEGLNLEAAGVEFDGRGVKVDRRLRSSNKRIFAAGDAAGGLQFTHVAGYHAGIVIRNVLFRLPAKASNKAIPWVTFCDPELAHVGWTEEQARSEVGDIRILRWPFAENDRARAERETRGLVKIIAAKNGKILGASILGAHAGELIHPWTLAITQGMKIGAMAGAVAPYPTLSEAGKRAAGGFYTEKLFGSGTRRLVRFLLKFA
ncbi:MAG: FAD-dependent oxidoreductase, partial [Kiloniellales bacterium]|nr:FAD-dependent oxidoreductase [Kiloniellales bacterium]